MLIQSIQSLIPESINNFINRATIQHVFTFISTLWGKHVAARLLIKWLNMERAEKCMVRKTTLKKLLDATSQDFHKCFPSKS